jgi:hypothetical protein
MNTRALVATLSKKISSLNARLGQLCRNVFGNISYRPPAWVVSMDGRSRQIERKHPRLIAFTIIGVCLTFGAAAWTWNWYQHLPKPKRVAAKVQPIPVTKLQAELKFPPLVIYFTEPAARLEENGDPRCAA